MVRNVFVGRILEGRGAESKSFDNSGIPSMIHGVFYIFTMETQKGLEEKTYDLKGAFDNYMSGDKSREARAELAEAILNAPGNQLDDLGLLDILKLQDFPVAEARTKMNFLLKDLMEAYVLSLFAKQFIARYRVYIQQIDNRDGALAVKFSAVAFSKENVCLNVVAALRKKGIEVSELRNGCGEIVLGMQEFEDFIKKDDPQEIVSSVSKKVEGTMR